MAIGYGTGKYSKGRYGVNSVQEAFARADGYSFYSAKAVRVPTGYVLDSTVSGSYAMSRVAGGSAARSDTVSSTVLCNAFRVRDAGVGATLTSGVIIRPTLVARAEARADILSGVVRADSNAKLMATAIAHILSGAIAKGRGIYLPSEPDDTLWTERPTETEIWTPITDNTSIWQEAVL